METNLFKIYDFGDENHTKGAHVFLTKLEVITLDGSNTGSVYDKDNNKIILTKRINQEDRIVLSEQCGILPPVEIGLFVFDEKESTQSQYIYKKK